MALAYNPEPFSGFLTSARETRVIELLIRGLVAQQAPAGDGGGGAGLIQFLPILLMFAVIYFIMIRPQQKQAKKHREYLAGLKKGDEVITNSGIFGRIDAIEENAVRLEIARDVRIRVLKSQVAGPQPGAASSGFEGKKE
jgi:preprotein translocase subunit YajC